MSQRELHSYQWNGSEWTKYKPDRIFHQQPESQLTNKTVRIATFNILADCFPWFIEMTIRSSERFECLCHKITDLNPTIIGLNEVTTNALRQLQNCSFIREHYFITECESTVEPRSYTNGLLSPHGCVILSKLPFIELFAVSVSGSSREAVIGKVQLGSNYESQVYICSHHTTAYQTPKNAQLRAQQVQDIVNILNPYGFPFIIMGDLNLHYPFEDSIVTDNKFVDAWAQTHFSDLSPFNDRNPGYTFDANANHLIPYYIPGECRQMRLDRILFSEGFPASAVTPCHLWANEPIKIGNYLFPSDHFGLSIDLTTNVQNKNVQTISLSKLDRSVEQILLSNVQNTENRHPYRLGLVRTTLALTSHIIWLTAVALGLK